MSTQDAGRAPRTQDEHSGAEPSDKHAFLETPEMCMCDHMSQKVSDKRRGCASVNIGNVFLNTSQAPLRQARRTLLSPLVESQQRQTVCGGLVGECHHTTAAHRELCH